MNQSFASSGACHSAIYPRQGGVQSRTCGLLGTDFFRYIIRHLQTRASEILTSVAAPNISDGKARGSNTPNRVASLGPLISLDTALAMVDEAFHCEARAAMQSQMGGLRNLDRP